MNVGQEDENTSFRMNSPEHSIYSPVYHASEMGPVWQNPIQRNTRTAHLSVFMTVHSFSTEHNTEQFW